MECIGVIAEENKIISKFFIGKYLYLKEMCYICNLVRNT